MLQQRRFNAVTLPPLAGTAIENFAQPPRMVESLQPYNVSSFWWDWPWNWGKDENEDEQPVPEKRSTMPATREYPTNILGIAALIVCAFLLTKYL